MNLVQWPQALIAGGSSCNGQVLLSFWAKCGNTLKVAMTQYGKTLTGNMVHITLTLLLQIGLSTWRFSCTRSASLLASAVSRILLCSRKAALDCPRPVSFPRSCSNSRASFLFDSSRCLIFFLKPLDSWSWKILIHVKLHALGRSGDPCPWPQYLGGRARWISLRPAWL